MDYQSDYILRVIEQMGAAMRLATRLFAEGAPAEESIDATNQAIGLVVDVPAVLFVRMSPQTMVSLLEMSGSDNRLLEKVAEALLLQADVFEAEGSFIESGVRREQAAAVLGFIDPAHAN
ncbi:MAG TPA: hypothetical protein VIL41_07515 [Coriobacteriia bacterium]